VKLKVRHGAFKQLHALGKDVMDRIDSKLTSGEGGMVVARWLQDDCGLLTEVRTATLKKTLERYRESDLRNRVLQRITEAQSTLAIKTVAKRLNAMDELEEIVRVQRLRVDKLLAKEKDMPNGLVLTTASSEIRLLKDMLVNLGSIQLETGFIAKAPKKIIGHMIGEDGQVREFAWTEEQEALFNELEGREADAAEDA
jgi:hypothetical protein